MPEAQKSESPADENKVTPATVEATPQDGTTAQSSGADEKSTDANSPEVKSPLDVIRDVVAKPAPASSKPDAAEKQDSSKPDKPVEGEADAEKDPPFHTHPAWKRQVEARRAAESRVTELEPAAREYHAIQSFMEQSQLTQNDVVRLLSVGALIRLDPDKALVELEKVTNEVRELIGDVLPADLAAEVEDGTISEARAKELNRARKASERSIQAVEQEREARTTTEQQRKAQEHAGALNAEIIQWETEQKTSDPNFAAKQQDIQDRVELVIARELKANPKKMFTPTEARTILDQAKKFVDEKRAATVPPRREVKPPLNTPASSAHQAASGGKKSSLDIIKAGGRS